MLTYLLLRDNKEAGPFTLDELLKLGLKPYDLVWITGKSAAWRYPSEINELKPYAPEVEEQPYDRFFKKPAATTSAEHVAVPEPEPETVSAHEAYAPKVAVSAQPAYVARKSVFVTLPGQQAEKKITPKPQPATPKPTPAPIPDYTMADAGETISITENPVAKIKYSQPLDDIKEMYVKTLKDRKDRMARKSFVKVGLNRAAVVVGLIGVGVLAGFILKSKPAAHSDLAQTVASPVLNTAINSNTGSDAESIPETSAIPNNENAPAAETPQQQKENKAVVSMPAADMKTDLNAEQPTSKKDAAAPSSNTRRPAAVMPAPQTRDETPVQQVYSAAEKDPVTGERNRAVRSEQKENGEQKAVPVSSNESSAAYNERQLSGLGNQVSVSSNDYKRVALGGIRNLELTVTNRSKYELDQVMVELQYLKPSEQPVKTELIQFKSIPANESATIRVPDTNRGVKVQFRIVRIGSSETAVK